MATKEKQITLTYDKRQLKKVAKFIWKKNPYACRFSNGEVDIVEAMKNTLMRYAREVKSSLNDERDWRYIATAGYFIFITLEDKNSLFATILADLTVSDDPRSDDDYVTIEL